MKNYTSSTFFAQSLELNWECGDENRIFEKTQLEKIFGDGKFEVEILYINRQTISTDGFKIIKRKK